MMRLWLCSAISLPIRRRFVVDIAVATLLAVGVAALDSGYALAQPNSSNDDTTQMASQMAGNTRAANTPPPTSKQPSSYTLGSGDHVKITVYGQDDMGGEYLVDGAGYLAFPLIGRVRAGGLTAEQLCREIESKLSPDYLKNPHVSAEVLTYRPFYIIGEVKSPGSYAYVSGMTVLNAVALAGGFTYRARDDSFYVTRTEANGQKEQLDADPTSNILPGDIITVRERYF